MAALPPVVSFWRGPITWIERLCVASMHEAGHRVQVFSYEPEILSRTGLDCEILDARDVIPAPNDIPSRKFGTTAESVISDIFRFALLKQERGLWSDMDCLFLRPMDLAGEIFGWESPKLIGTAVLRLAPDSPVLNDLVGFSQKRPVICPWWPLEKSVRRRVRYVLTRTSTPPREAPFGPRAVTYFLEKHGRHHSALGAEAFYPVPVARASDMIDAVDPVTPALTEDTRIVHLWRSQLSKLSFPPPMSFLGKQIKRLCI